VSSWLFPEFAGGVDGAVVLVAHHAFRVSEEASAVYEAGCVLEDAWRFSVAQQDIACANNLASSDALRGRRLGGVHADDLRRAGDWLSLLPICRCRRSTL